MKPGVGGLRREVGRTLMGQPRRGPQAGGRRGLRHGFQGEESYREGMPDSQSYSKERGEKDREAGVGGGPRPLRSSYPGAISGPASDRPS